jgi:drug/metabolite transporter (DMT)-like permease
MFSPRTIASLAIIANVIIWAAALPIIKPALDHVSPYEFLFLRYLIAVPFMIPIMVHYWPTNGYKKNIIKPTLIESIQIIIQLSLLYEGLKLTTAIEASILSAIAPVLIVLGGIYFLKEIQEVNEWRGLILGIIGSLIIIITPFMVTGESLGFSITGNMLVIGSILAWTTYVLLAKKYYHNQHKLFNSGIACLIGLIFFGTITGFSHGLSNALVQFITQPSVFFAAVYMGTLGAPIALSLYLYGQDKIEASEATLFSYLAPLVYIPLSVLWLKESLIPIQLVGLLIIGIGVIIAQRRAKPNNLYPHTITAKHPV